MNRLLPFIKRFWTSGIIIWKKEAVMIMNAMNATMPRTAKITATAVAAVLAGSLMIVPAEAEAGSWNSRGVKGAHAQGQTSRKNGRSYINGYVKDTACDSRIAELFIYFGGSFPRKENAKASQCGAVTHFSFNSQHRPVKVQECTRSIWRSHCGPSITVIR